MPRIAKIEKKKSARPMTPLRALIDMKRVSTSIFIDGRFVRERKGLKRRKVFSPCMCLNYGIA